MQLFFHTGDRSYALIVDDSTPIEDVKEALETKTGYPVKSQRLVYRGTQLEDGRTLSHYKVQMDSTIHLFMRLRGD